MIDIIALFFLIRRIKNMVEEKEHPSGPWIRRILLYWFGGLFIGMFVSMFFFNTKDLTILGVSAYLCAIGASIVVYKKAENLPDNKNGGNDWFNNPGKDSYNS
jgi:polyferredoxin